jgi:hypothetical protein
MEARARRAAKRVGLSATKSRTRLYCFNYQGGFRLVDPYINSVVNGVNYDMSAEDVIEFCREESQ